MHQSLFYQALLTLTPLERKHLGQWLDSPYLSRRGTSPALYQYCCKCITDRVEPDRDIAVRLVLQSEPPRPYKRTFADQPPKPIPASEQQADQMLRLALSELLGHLERFLVHEAHFNVPTFFKTRLAAVYRQRGLAKHYQQVLREARKAWEAQPYRHAEYWSGMADIEYEAYQHLSEGRRTEELNLQTLSDQTDTAYMAQKLRQACFALSHLNVYRADYDFGLLDAVLAHIGRSTMLQAHPAIGLYYYCYRFLTQPDDSSAFLTFKAALLASTEQLPVAEQRNLHLLAINYCIKKLNQSDPIYLREALDLYQSALRGGLLLDNGVLSQFAFNNIVAIALKVNEDAWAEQFVHDFMGFIERKHRQAAYHLNLARIAYKRGQSNEAMLHLQEADYKDLINNLIAKTLQLKIYYESDEFDALDAHLQSMQTFIRRQTGIGYHKTNYLNVIKYTRKLMRLPLNNSQERQVLRLAIEQEPVLMEKEWLLSQIG
jgi:hypothetical protein